MKNILLKILKMTDKKHTNITKFQHCLIKSSTQQKEIDFLQKYIECNKKYEVKILKVHHCLVIAAIFEKESDFIKEYIECMNERGGKEQVK